MSTGPSPAWPDSPEALAGAVWDDLAPWYEELARRRLDDVERWLADWSRLEELLGEARALASIAYTLNTADDAREEAHLRWSGRIWPMVMEQRARLGRRLLESGYTAPDLETTLERLRNEADLFRAQNVTLQSEHQRLAAAWQKLTGSFTAAWGGRQVPLPALREPESDPDREVREKAFRLHYQPFVQKREEIADIFDRLFEVRSAMARNAGFGSYRDYVHAEKNRFDYTPADCERFDAAILEAVVPATRRIMERRRRTMGLDSLRPWDGIDGNSGTADARGRPPLRPYSSQAELVEGGRHVFDALGKWFGKRFGTLDAEGLLDLESRPGKAPGGYSTTLPHRRRPYIFMNGTGSAGDVRTLLHEAGHAFHSFAALEALPLVFQRQVGSEIAEVASMSMELLAAPFLERSAGGWFSAEDARRYRFEHLETSLPKLAYIGLVDAFQQWIYTSAQGQDREARDRMWRELHEQYQPGIDWSGAEELRVARWYAQPHPYTHPFYYIEYGLAQLGAFQVWRNSLADPAGALQAYQGALALGGSRPLPQLYAAAGARMVFDAGEMAELVAFVEGQIEAMSAP